MGGLSNEPLALRQWPQEIGLRLKRCDRLGRSGLPSTPAKRLGSIARPRWPLVSACTATSSGGAEAGPTADDRAIDGLAD
jgi:hypothetical protein